MSYSTPPPVIKHGYELFISKLGNTPVAVGDVFATPIIIAKWQIIRDPTVLAKQVPIVGIMFSAAGRRTVGVGNVNLSLATSPDDITYNNLQSTGSANAAYVDLTTSPIDDRIPDTENYFALLLSNSNGATAGDIKEIAFYGWLQPPLKHTIKRII